MKERHQITLLGGQILPVYLGIIERKPQVLHIIYSKETSRLRKRLTNIINQSRIYEYQVDAYDYVSIQEIVSKIIFDNEEADFELNLTSGTKLMALASQEVFKTLDCFSFYIDQNQNMIDISKGKIEKIKAKISTKDFLSISNHDNFSSELLNSYSSEDRKLAESIFEERKKKSGIAEVLKLLRELNVDPETSSYNYKNKKVSISWDYNRLYLKTSKFELRSNSENSFKILTTGLWWEIIVGIAISSWKKAFQTHMNIIIKSNSNKHLDKNEIDLLINTGQKLFFIECKSGIVFQSDINKMRAISKLYGGNTSKSILVSYYKPKEHLLEKCRDFNIEIIYIEEKDKKFNDLKSSLVKRLDLISLAGEL